MENTAILKDYSDTEKGAYLGAIASLATADHKASDEEMTYLSQLSEAAELSETQKQVVQQAANEISGDELNKCIAVLSSSDLRFSLITDLISFAKSDGNYNDQEKMNIEKVAQQLKIDTKQFSLLDHFVTKTESAKSTDQATPKGFLESLGLSEKFKEAGIDMSSLGKGLLAIAAPLLLGKLFMGGNRNRFGGMPNSSRTQGTGSMGGFGSVISALNMGRGFGSTGGLLSKILGRRF